jgi:hypothetical protein
MHYAIVEDGGIKEHGPINSLFPNTSFPFSGPNESFMQENNMVSILEYIEHDSSTHKMVFCDPYILDNSVYRVQAVEFSNEEKVKVQNALSDFEALQEAN